MMSNEMIKAESQLTKVNNTPTIIDFRRDRERYPRLFSCQREIAVTEVEKIVLQAFQYRGQQTDRNNLHFIASTLVNELLADSQGIGTKNITLAEIAYIIKKATLAGDLFGISVVTLYKAIADYISNEGQEAEDEIYRQKVKRDREALNKSAVAPMLKTFAGAIVRKK